MYQNQPWAILTRLPSLKGKAIFLTEKKYHKHSVKVKVR